MKIKSLEFELLAMSYTIVIIDDSKVIVSSLTNFLRSQDKDMYIYEANNGSVGISRCRECKPDLIILDLLMPYMNGLQFLINRKKEYDFKDTPVIVVSSVKDMTVIRKALELGAVSYLTKPIDFAKFKEQVFLWLGIHLSSNYNKGKAETYIMEDIIITEISGGFSRDFLNPVKYRLIEVTKMLRSSLKRFIIILYDVPEEDITDENFTYFFKFYLEIEGVSQKNIKILSQQKNIIHTLTNNVYTKHIEIVKDFQEGYNKLKMQIIENTKVKIPLSCLTPGASFFTELYDLHGHLIKAKGEKFTEDEIKGLESKGVKQLVYEQANCTSVEDIKFIDPQTVKRVEELNNSVISGA